MVYGIVNWGYLQYDVLELERDYFKGLTLKAIGKKEGISESRVCQIHGRMLDRLAERLENQA